MVGFEPLCLVEHLLRVNVLQTGPCIIPIGRKFLVDPWHDGSDGRPTSYGEKGARLPVRFNQPWSTSGIHGSVKKRDGRGGRGFAILGVQPRIHRKDVDVAVLVDIRSLEGIPPSMVTRQAAYLCLMNQSLTLLLEELNGTILQSHHQIDQAIPVEVAP